MADAVSRRASGAWRISFALAVAAALLAGCDRGDKPLPGQRIEILSQTEPSGTRARPISLPAAVPNADWSHRNGSAGGRLTNPALAPVPQLRWSLTIGAGEKKRTRLLVSPIVAGGLIFAIDSQGLLSAVARNGGVVWTQSLIPPGQLAGAGPGGGLAQAGGVLYVTTGYGETMALDPATGGVYWRRQFDAPVRSAPVVQGGRVFLVLRNDTAMALEASSGEPVWQIESGGGPGLLGGATPAVDGATAVIPFASGEVRGVSARDGAWLWGTEVVTSPEFAARSQITDISGDPVIDGNAIYGSSQNGRTIRIDRSSGERLWTMSDGAYGPVWPVGGSIFLVTDNAVLVRADASTGEEIWTTQLTQFHPNRNWFGDRRPSRAVTHFGPILAGGRLWVASGDAVLRGFSPVNGALLAEIPLPAPAAAPPAVAGGVMYLVTTNGQLHALQ